MPQEYELVLRNVQYVNLHTLEIYPAEIGIANGCIARVTQPGESALVGAGTYDAKGRYAIPGLIDTHVHMESSMITPAAFSDIVVPRGTTTVLADPHEVANVAGLSGMELMLEWTEDLPLSVFILAPSCVPSVPGLETSCMAFDKPEIAKMLANPRVIGLGEVMDYPGVIKGDGRMKRILQAAQESGKFIQGHAPGVMGEDLARYLAAGVESDHETYRPEEAREKLRAGMTLELREASNGKNISGLGALIAEMGYPEQVTFCTDDREPGDLLEEGHMDQAVRAAIRAGMQPVQAIKCATLNAARLARLHDRGVLTPGKRADIALVGELAAMDVHEVFVAGKLVADGGKMLCPSPLKATDSATQSVHLGRPVTPQDFLVHCEGGAQRLHTIRYSEEDRFVTKLGVHDFPVVEGACQINETEDFATFAVLERHGVNGNRSVAPVQGLGLTGGAVATTVSHDSHNLFVCGKSAKDMALAANTLAACGGGVCCVENGAVRSLLELPLFGLMSTEDTGTVAGKMHHLQVTMQALGLTTSSPFLQLASFALAVIPEVRLTDKGLVDTLNQTLLPLFAE